MKMKARVTRRSTPKAKTFLVQKQKPNPIQKQKLLSMSSMESDSDSFSYFNRPDDDEDCTRHQDKLEDDNEWSDDDDLQTHAQLDSKQSGIRHFDNRNRGVNNEDDFNVNDDEDEDEDEDDVDADDLSASSSSSWTSRSLSSPSNVRPSSSLHINPPSPSSSPSSSSSSRQSKAKNASRASKKTPPAPPSTFRSKSSLGNVSSLRSNSGAFKLTLSSPYENLANAKHKPAFINASTYSSSSSLSSLSASSSFSSPRSSSASIRAISMPFESHIQYFNSASRPNSDSIIGHSDNLSIRYDKVTEAGQDREDADRHIDKHNHQGNNRNNDIHNNDDCDDDDENDVDNRNDLNRFDGKTHLIDHSETSKTFQSSNVIRSISSAVSPSPPSHSVVTSDRASVTIRTRMESPLQSLGGSMVRSMYRPLPDYSPSLLSKGTRHDKNKSAPLALKTSW
jgi:hypothetical protein